jgi:PAS domain S-box-containing protein
MNLKNAGIGTQLKLSFAAMLFFVILLSVISYWQSGRIHKQTETMYEHPLQTRRALENIESNVLNMRINIRDYLLIDDNTTRQTMLNEIAVNQSNVLINIDKLRSCYLGPSSDIDLLMIEFTKWVSIRQETVRMVTAGHLVEARRRHVPGGIAPSQFEKVLGSLDKISNFALKKGDELFTNSRELIKLLNYQLILLVAIILLFSLLVNYILYRNIRNPLNDLTLANKKFQEGDFTARSSYTSRNEFGILSASFNQLAEHLQVNLNLNEKIAELSALMMVEEDAKTFFPSILSALANHTGSQMAALYLLNDNKDTFDHFYSIGLDEKARQKFEANSFEGEFGRAIATRNVQYIETIPDNTPFVFPTVSGTFRPMAIITIPIVAGNETIAIISLASISTYNNQTLQLIDKMLVALSSRINGVLSTQKIKAFSVQLEWQKEELAKVSKYTRSLIEASVDPLVTIGIDGKIMDVNSTTEKITGLSRKELVGTDFSDYFTEPERAKAGYLQVFSEGFVRNYELAIRHSSGEITPVHYNASVYRDEEGKAIGVFAAARDITERKKAEKELNERSENLAMLNMELEAQKNELSSQSSELMIQNAELEMQKKQLDEANRLKTIFLSNMSHELRTPLNSVIALSGVLNRRLSNKIPDEEHSYLEVIERNGKHLLDLINDILDISRIEAGKEEIEIVQFNINNTIGDVVSMIHPQAKLKNIELIHTSASDVIPIASDVGKIRHIIQNLIGNAVKFTEHGVVSIEAKKINNTIAITVTDTGIGITEKNQLHIFDEFRQADSGTARKYGGTGLGLAIAKKYTNFLGGDISVKSKLGEGSVFTVTLPLEYSFDNDRKQGISSDLLFTPSSNVSIPLNENGIKTILLVEDSEPAIIQIKDILDENKFRILVARDGQQALDIIGQTLPDAMILDLMMPGIDGFEVLKTVRENELTSQLPVLILTAKHITKEELRFLKSNNVHQLIQKGNVNRDELLNAVATMVFKPIEVPEQFPKELPTIEGKPLVLVVEDNPDNLITVKAILADGFYVLEATNGNAGVEMAKKHCPNLILMDIQLPGLDGINAFKQIRSEARLQHIPVIALTASAMTNEREAILAHGFDAYIAKPIDENNFFKTIKEILYGK